MKELIDSLEKTDRVNYLIDTCFFVNVFTSRNVKELVNFCKENKVGMSSFNLEEFNHIHHNLQGHIVHHVRDFLKEKIMFNSPVNVTPGNKEAERVYVESFDDKILSVISDPSDAVLFVQAIKTQADILTKDRHHIFTAAAENYSEEYNIKVMNEFPGKM